MNTKSTTNTKPKTNYDRYWILLFLSIFMFGVVRFNTTQGMRIYTIDGGDNQTQLPSYMTDPLAQIDRVGRVAEVDMKRTVGLWVTAFLTLGVFSFIYGDNPIYKVSESVFVGVSAAYWMVLSFWTTLVPNLFGKLFPKLIQSSFMPGLSPVYEDDWMLYIIPLILGVMLLMRLSSKGSWLARWPLAFIIGSTAGIRLYGFLEGDLLGPLAASINAPIPEGAKFDYAGISAAVNNILTLLCILAVITYFFFSIEHKGGVGVVARSGIWVLMITFGAAFGLTVMGRIALLAGRFQFLIDNWLDVMHPGGV